MGAIGAPQPNSEMTMTTRIKIVSALAVAAALTATTLMTEDGAHAGGVSKGGNPIKPQKNPIVNTIHPIVRNCNGPDTLCRRP